MNSADIAKHRCELRELLLVIAILLWGYGPFVQMLGHVNVSFAWPALHNAIQRMPPVLQKLTNYAAMFNFNWLSAAGTATVIVAFVLGLWLGMTQLQTVDSFGNNVG